MSPALPVVALVSGRGTNLGALLAAHARGTLPIDFRAVISNRPRAPALARAGEHGVTSVVVDHTAYAERAAFDTDLAATIDRFQPGLIIMAGFMRILTDDFITRYRDRMLNIHPSLLPQLRGLNTHQRALDAGLERHGATVHFVTPALDGGPPVLQATVPVHRDDDAGTLAARVLEREHRIYPLAVRWFAEGRLTFDGVTAYLDGAPLDEPIVDPPEIDHGMVR